MVVGGGGWWINPLQTLPQGLVFTFDFDFDPDPDPELDNSFYAELNITGLCGPGKLSIINQECCCEHSYVKLHSYISQN